MKFNVTKEFIHQVLDWIEEGATKDSKGKNYDPEVGTLLNKIKSYCSERKMSFKQNMMIPLFKMDISSISDYSSLDVAYDEKNNSLPVITGLEANFLSETVEEIPEIDTSDVDVMEDYYEPHLEEIEERPLLD